MIMNKKRNFYRTKREKVVYNPPYSEELMNKPLAELKLLPRTMDALNAAKLSVLRDIAVRTEKDMYKIQNFGKKNLEDVRRAITGLKVDFKPEADARADQTATAPAKPAKVRPTEPGAPEEWVKFTKNGKWGIKDLLGHEVIPAQYDEIFRFKENLACFEQKGNFGYINAKNEVVIAPEYECAMSFSEGLASVALNNKSGYIDSSGKVVIDFIYDAGTAFCDGKARVKTDGKWIVIDNTGKILKE